MKINYEFSNQLQEYAGMKVGQLVAHNGNGIVRINKITRQFNKLNQETSPAFEVTKLYTLSGNRATDKFTRSVPCSYLRPLDQLISTREVEIQKLAEVINKLKKLEHENKV